MTRLFFLANLTISLIFIICLITLTDGTLFRSKQKCSFYETGDKAGVKYKSKDNKTSICCDPSVAKDMKVILPGIIAYLNSDDAPNCCLRKTADKTCFFNGLRPCIGKDCLLNFSLPLIPAVELITKNTGLDGILNPIIGAVLPADVANTGKLVKSKIRYVQQSKCLDKSKPLHFIKTVQGQEGKIFGDYCCSADFVKNYTVKVTDVCCALAGTRCASYIAGNPGTLSSEAHCCRSMPNGASMCDVNRNLTAHFCQPLAGLYDRTPNLNATVPLGMPRYPGFLTESIMQTLPGLSKVLVRAPAQGSDPVSGQVTKILNVQCDLPKMTSFFFFASPLIQTITQLSQGFGLCCKNFNIFALDPLKILNSCCIMIYQLTALLPDLPCEALTGFIPELTGNLTGGLVRFKACMPNACLNNTIQKLNTSIVTLIEGPFDPNTYKPYQIQRTVMGLEDVLTGEVIP